jgi:hypothetical protein
MPDTRIGIHLVVVVVKAVMMMMMMMMMTMMMMVDITTHILMIYKLGIARTSLSRLPCAAHQKLKHCRCAWQMTCDRASSCGCLACNSITPRER